MPKPDNDSIIKLGIGQKGMMSEYKGIGIGKFIMETSNEDFNIPHLHFILLKEKNEDIQALNLEFGLVCSGHVGEEEFVIENLADMTTMFIKSTLNDAEGFVSFKKLACSLALEEFWAEYRKIEFTLAEKKRDLGSSVIQHIKDKVTQAIFEKYGIKPTAQFSIINKDVA
ncbi:MAG: hypothetical protein SPE30_07690 [Candidatus Treponema excrementipullorum]|nr:hypothetical protein [Candidatus Treponema excrementipullorum]MDY4707626.1 hypothetical protein [Candidatus Treponema excrementipullorum]